MSEYYEQIGAKFCNLGAMKRDIKFFIKQIHSL